MENSSYELHYIWQSHCKVGKTSPKTSCDENKLQQQADGNQEDCAELINS